MNESRRPLERWLLLGGALVVACFIIVGLVRGGDSATAQAWRPTDDGLVLERLAASVGKPAEGAALRRARLALASGTAPVDGASAISLALRYIELSRSTSDPRYLGHAEALLAPLAQDKSAPPAVWLLRATLRQSRHDFDGALVDLDRALALDAGDPQAWLTRAVLFSVRAQYDEARRSCRPLGRLAGAFASAICVASIDALTGQARAAYHAVIGALARPGVTPVERAWALTLAGEIAARAGDTAAAERHYRAALASGVRDPYALAALADLLLDADRPTEVLAVLAGEESADALLLRLCLAAQRAADGQRSRLAGLLRERFAAARARGDAVHQREEARFTLHVERSPSEALRLATENWRVQREPADARILLEAAYAAQEPASAAGALLWVARSGIEDVGLRALAAALQSVQP